MTALAEKTDLSLTWGFRAVLTWVAGCLTSVSAFNSLFVAPHTATVLKKMLSGDDALAWRMADLLALMTTLELSVT